MNLQPRAILCDPPVLYTTAREDITIALDMTALLSDGDPPTLPETILFLPGVYEAVDLPDPPTLEGNSVQQRLRGLLHSTCYTLYASVETGGMRREVALNINVARD